MEFRFDINNIFKEPIVELNNNLIPPGFCGDRRALMDTVMKVTEVVNAIGEASANAQGLTKPITTADRLRNSEHKLYLLVDNKANNGKGAVTGLLKTGHKGLYVFDRDGQHYQVQPPCVLDFYVHESRQRHGLGKQLFEHMLEKEKVHPVKLAIDRPSDKFLSFLNKHYQLRNPIKQMNNYVVFDGFFNPQNNGTPNVVNSNYTNNGRVKSANGLQNFVPSSPYGRYGAPRPHCSMGQIIHNQSSTIQKSPEPTGAFSEPYMNYQQGQQQFAYNNPNNYYSQSLPNMNSNMQYSNQNPFPPNPGYYPQNNMYPSASNFNQFQMTPSQMQNNYQQNPNGPNYLNSTSSVPNNFNQMQNQFTPSQNQMSAQNQNQYVAQQNEMNAQISQRNNSMYSNNQYAYNNQYQDSTNQMQFDQKVDLMPTNLKTTDAYPSQTKPRNQVQNTATPVAPNESFNILGQPIVEYPRQEMGFKEKANKNMKPNPKPYRRHQDSGYDYEEDPDEQKFDDKSKNDQKIMDDNPSHQNVTPNSQIVTPQQNQVMEIDNQNIQQNEKNNLQNTINENYANSNQNNMQYNNQNHFIQNSNQNQTNQNNQMDNLNYQQQDTNYNNQNQNQNQNTQNANLNNNQNNIQESQNISRQNINQLNNPNMQQPPLINNNNNQFVPPPQYISPQNLPAYYPYMPPQQLISAYGLTPTPPMNYNVPPSPPVSDQAKLLPAVTTPIPAPRTTPLSTHQLPQQQMLSNNMETSNQIPPPNNQVYAPLPVEPPTNQQQNMSYASMPPPQPMINPPNQNYMYNQNAFVGGVSSQPNMSPTPVYNLQGVSRSDALINQSQNQNYMPSGPIETNTYAEGTTPLIEMRNKKSKLGAGAGDNDLNNNDIVLSNGYPPQKKSHAIKKEPETEKEQEPEPEQNQQDEKPASPKLERPRSLVIQSNGEEDAAKNNEVNETDKAIDNEENNEDAVEEIQKATEQIQINEEVEKTVKKTPSHLTEQGFFDLKFYHNKLW